MPTEATPAPEEFDGEVTVASRIIDYLSSGLYESPAACLKELVNNSYDADATEVRVFVKPDANRIIIEDNGTGMNRTEFEQHFRRIAESHKRDNGKQRTKSGRPKIGKIGIGLIAANELCEVLEIHSTKRGSRELLRVKLDFTMMVKPIEERRREGPGIAKADYHGEVAHDAAVNEHYTKLYLLNVRNLAVPVLVGATNVLENDASSLYGKNADSIFSILRDEVTDWDQLDLYSTTMLHVALNVPILYYEDWMPRPRNRVISSIEKETRELNFAVNYDGTRLRKPVVFAPEPENYFVERFNLNGEHVSAYGYFYAQRPNLKPRQLRGVLVRIRHAAIGEYDDSFLGFPGTRFPLFQNWVSAEILASDELEEAMNIDRRTFRETHPAFVELRAAFHSQLEDVLSRARRELYQERSKRRQEQQALDQQEKMRDVMLEVSTTYGPTVARNVGRTLRVDSRDKADSSQWMRRVTVAELYERVIAAARETLDAKSFSAFISELDRQLRL